MDLRYETALRNTASAWAKSQAVDASTMQDLKRGLQHQALERQAPVQRNTADLGAQQPELARYGTLGTQLNLFA